jgi:hypothetical protein
MKHQRASGASPPADHELIEVALQLLIDLPRQIPYGKFTPLETLAFRDAWR